MIPSPTKTRELEPTANLYYGPMTAGKTNRVIDRMYVMSDAGYNCLLIKYDKDVRISDSEVCVSKSGSKYRAIMVPKDGLIDMVNNPDNPYYARLLDADCVGIDEVQFFKDSVDFVTLMLLQRKKSVYMAGLDTDFRNEPWGYLAPMIAICTVAEKLRGVCHECRSLNGCTSSRISNNTDLEVIGGRDEYATLCLPCYARTGVHRPDHLNVAY